MNDYLKYSARLKEDMNNYIKTNANAIFETLKTEYPEILTLSATAHFNESTPPFLRIFCKTTEHGCNIEVKYTQQNMDQMLTQALHDNCVSIIKHYKRNNS